MARTDNQSHSVGQKAILVGAQLSLFLTGATLTVLWIGWGILPKTWWGALPVVAILLLSLIVFSFQESRIGIAKRVRHRKGNPEGLGGALELMAFVTWLFLLVNMVVTVFRVIRAIRGAF